MKLSQLFEAAGEFDERRRKDGKKDKHLKIIDQNIEMFKRLPGNNEARVKEMEGWKDDVEKFYSGKIASWQSLPAGLKELLMDMPDWGTKGT